MKTKYELRTEVRKKNRSNSNSPDSPDGNKRNRKQKSSARVVKKNPAKKLVVTEVTQIKA